MTKISLRDYQQDIIKQTINSGKSTLIQIPTGGGKTLIAKEIAKYLSNNLNQQVLFVAPKIVLMEQTAKVFRELNPHIVHKDNPYDKKHKILVSTIQTASRRDINPDVLIIDEIHHGFKGKMIQALMQKPNTRVIGLSATPYDEDGNMLKGFELILDQYDIKYMVENNYLTTIKPFELIKIRKLESVKIINGDYDVQELSKIMCNNKTVLEIVGSTVEYIVNYKKTIVFAVDIGHAELLAEAYKKEGFSAKAIHSKLNAEDNAQDIEKFKNGEIQILISVLMLTTGFDVPDVEVAVLARPTKSKNLYRQMVGRVLRKAENKTHAILLDCGNVIENLGMPLEDIEATKKQETRNSKQKCEKCESENLKLKYKDDKSFWECGDCGHVRSIEHGTYECKSCHKLYTYSKDRFSIKSNKLYLNCDNCPYPTFISEYTGSEVFVEVIDKTEEKKREEKNKNLKNIKSNWIVDKLKDILNMDTEVLKAQSPGFISNPKYLLVLNELSEVDDRYFDAYTKKLIDDILFVTKNGIELNLSSIAGMSKEIPFLKKYKRNIDFTTLTKDNVIDIINNIVKFESILKATQDNSGMWSNSSNRKKYGTLFYFLRGFDNKPCKLEDFKINQIKIFINTIDAIKSIKNDGYRFNMKLYDNISITTEILKEWLNNPVLLDTTPATKK